jgi:hypothetical protein
MTNDLDIAVRTNKRTYTLNEEMKVSIIVTNKGQTPVELTFLSTQEYDIVILKEAREVWRWSSDKMFAMAIGTLVLEPAKKKTYRATWIIKTETPGEYDVIGIIKSQSPLSEKKTIKIIA